MKVLPLLFFCTTSLFGIGQSIDQITFTGEAELLLELSHRFKSNYLTISQHEYRMAFTEKHPYERNLAETISKMERFHGYNWGVEVLPDFGDDGSLITPIGFDYHGGLFYNKVIETEGSYTSTINYISKNYKVYEDIVPKLNNQTGLQSGTISKNERYMILSMHGLFSHGSEDLYVVEFTDEGWTNISNLGGTVNSKYQEITPYLAVDNKTLFFASDRKGGMGGFDIYMSERLDDSWKQWTKPVNIEEINTLASETSFCFIDTDPYGYFIRADPSDVYGEIMQVPIEQRIEEEPSEAKITELSEKPYFKVVDGTSQADLPVELFIVDDQQNLVEGSGIFEADSYKGKTLIVKSRGYFSMQITVNESTPMGENTIHLEPLTIGASITLESVLFERAKPRILPSSYEQLNLLVDVMKENPTLNIKLKGHTDNKGNPASNLELSQQRVDAVTAFLREHGISRKRISGVGYGGQYPIASNETEETRRLNRRVEFEIIE